MNARALAAWSASGLTIALSTSNPVYRGLVFIAALNVLIALRRPDARIRPLMIALLVAAVIATTLTLLLSHTGLHPLTVLPAAIPVIGGAITLESLVFGVTTGLGIAAAVLAAAPLSLAIEPHELVDALPRALSRSGAALATAINMIPAVARSAAEIRDAQRMRGWRPGRMRDWPEIAVPVVLTAVEESVSLAEAMEARAYGSQRRSHFLVARWRPLDVTVAAVSLLSAFGFVALRIASTAGDWYPFPSLTVPPIETLAVLCCAVLALPALVRLR